MELCFAGSVYSLLLHAYFGYGIQLYFLFIVHVSIAAWIPSLDSPLSPTPTSFTPSHSRSLSRSIDRSIDRLSSILCLPTRTHTCMCICTCILYTLIHVHTCIGLWEALLLGSQGSPSRYHTSLREAHVHIGIYTPSKHST